MIKLNETPVRTARNFNINNIKIDEAGLKRKNQEFNNIEINGIDIEFADNNVSKCSLKYGVGTDLIKEVEDNANHKLRLTISNDSNVEIVNTFDEDNTSLIDNIEIIAKENTVSSVMVKYKAEKDLCYYHNGVIRVNAEKNSKVNLIVINLLNTNSDNFLSIENKINDNVILNCTIVDFGGKNSITNYYADITRKHG